VPGSVGASSCVACGGAPRRGQRLPGIAAPGARLLSSRNSTPEYRQAERRKIRLAGFKKSRPGSGRHFLNFLLRLARGAVQAFLFRARGCERPGVVATGCFCCRCFSRPVHSPPRGWLSSAGRALTWRCGWHFWCRLSVASAAGAPRQNICPAATGRIWRRQDRAQ
jgi:hypothetical protein